MSTTGTGGTPSTSADGPNDASQARRSDWLHAGWSRVVDRLAVAGNRSSRSAYLLLAGATGALVSQLINLLFSQERDSLPGYGLGIVAGAGSALVLWALESGFRRWNRLEDSGLRSWLVAGWVIGFATGYDLSDNSSSWITVVLLGLGVAVVSAILTVATKSLLPVVGLVLFIVAALAAELPNFDRSNVRVIVAAGLLIAIGFMVQEFSGSQGWYVVLVFGIAAAAGALVFGLERSQASPWQNWWFLGAVLLAFVVGVGLLSWRVLTWGWFWFISTTGCGVLLLLSNASGNSRQIGVFTLAVAVVAGAATSFSKTAFRLIAMLVLATLAVLAVSSGIQATSGGEARTAAVERERLAGLQTRIIGVHNCLSTVFDQAVDANSAAPNNTEETLAARSITSTSCAEAATAGVWRQLTLPTAPNEQAMNAKARLSQVVDSLLLIAEQTTEAVPPVDETTTDDAKAIAGDKDDAEEAPIDYTALRPDDRKPEIEEEEEEVLLQVKSDLDTRSALAASIAVRQLELDLIAIEVEFLGGEEEAPRATQRAVEASAAVTALEAALAAETTRTSGLRDLLVAGANDTAAKLFPGDNDDIALGPYGWLAIALVALMGYRRAEIANNRRLSAPIKIDMPVAKADFASDDRAHLRAIMEAELSRAGIEEPAALPGSVLTDELVELVQDDSLQGSRWVAALVKALKSIGFPAAGITVRPIVSVVAGLTTVTVWVHTTRTMKPLYTEAFTHEDPEEAVRRAAIFVARAALNYSRNVPRWGQWHSEDGVGFRLFHDALRSPSETDAELRAKRRALQAALTASPPTAQIRVELGHLEDLAHNHLRSLRVHLEVRVEHQRLLISGYRVATAASMLSGDLPDGWFSPANKDDRTAVVNLLEYSGMLERASWTRLWRRAGLGKAMDECMELRSATTVTDYDRTAKILLCVAWSEMTRIRHLLTVPAIIGFAGFQSERRYWSRFLSDAGYRRHTAEQFETARLIIELRLALLALPKTSAPTALASPLPPGPPAPAEQRTQRQKQEHVFALARRLEAIIDRPQIGSLALYNAACFWSLLSVRFDDLAEVATAFSGRFSDLAAAREWSVELLHRSRRSGRGAYPSRAWMKVDPDLNPLQGTRTFDELIKWLDMGERMLSAQRASTEPVLDVTAERNPV